jgi:hypothetical protein
MKYPLRLKLKWIAGNVGGQQKSFFLTESFMNQMYEYDEVGYFEEDLSCV